jgi:hypothetical protein
VIPVVARLGVAAVKHKLVVELTGWDNNTWDLPNWYRGGLSSHRPRRFGDSPWDMRGCAERQVSQFEVLPCLIIRRSNTPFPTAAMGAGDAPYIHVEERQAGPDGDGGGADARQRGVGCRRGRCPAARGLKPRKGTLIFSFNNIEAYQRFDPKNPFKSRMIDEDFNRTWGRLDQPATTLETRRAQVVRPFVERADFLLDLHSMHDDCVPLMLCGPLDRGAELAKRLGTPVDIVRDRGHAAGMRMRDYGAFGDPKSDKTALLIETGQHWRASSVVVAKDVTARFLAETGIVEASDLPADWKQPAPQASASCR